MVAIKQVRDYVDILWDTKETVPVYGTLADKIKLYSTRADVLAANLSTRVAMQHFIVDDRNSPDVQNFTALISVSRDGTPSLNLQDSLENYLPYLNSCEVQELGCLIEEQAEAHSRNYDFDVLLFHDRIIL